MDLSFTETSLALLCCLKIFSVNQTQNSLDLLIANEKYALVKVLRTFSRMFFDFDKCAKARRKLPHSRHIQWTSLVYAKFDPIFVSNTLTWFDISIYRYRGAGLREAVINKNWLTAEWLCNRYERKNMFALLHIAYRASIARIYDSVVIGASRSVYPTEVNIDQFVMYPNILSDHFFISRWYFKRPQHDDVFRFVYNLTKSIESGMLDGIRIVSDSTRDAYHDLICCRHRGVNCHGTCGKCPDFDANPSCSTCYGYCRCIWQMMMMIACDCGMLEFMEWLCFDENIYCPECSNEHTGINQYTKNIAFGDSILLQHAAGSGELHIVEFLLDNFRGKINPNANHKYAFRSACENGFLDIAMRLAGLFNYTLSRNVGWWRSSFNHIVSDFRLNRMESRVTSPQILNWIAEMDQDIMDDWEIR